VYSCASLASESNSVGLGTVVVTDRTVAGEYRRLTVGDACLICSRLDPCVTGCAGVAVTH